MRRLMHMLSNVDSGGRNVIFSILLVLTVFVAAAAMSEPLPSMARELPADAPTETPAPTRPTITPFPTGTATVEFTPTRTPIPPELLENADATEGIIIGTILLVIIVLVGTIAGINVRHKQHHDG